jgi:hypothetical protein
MNKNQVDMTKLSKLIKECAVSGVKELELVDLVRVKFGASTVYEEKAPEPEFLNPHPVPSDDVASRKEFEQMLEDEMLHLTDPTAWQENLLRSESDEKIIATEGEQENVDV